MRWLNANTSIAFYKFSDEIFYASNVMQFLKQVLYIAKMFCPEGLSEILSHNTNILGCKQPKGLCFTNKKDVEISMVTWPYREI